MLILVVDSFFYVEKLQLHEKRAMRNIHVTARSRDLFERLIIVHTFKKFPDFNEILRLVTVSTKSRC